MSRTLVVFLSDTHGGNRFGLMRPGIELYEEDEEGNLSPWQPEPTSIQRWLWRCYEEDLARLTELAHGDRILAFHNGDLTHGVKYPQELVSTREGDQLLIAIENIRHLIEVPNVAVLRLVQGTGSHGFFEGTAALLVAEQLRALYPMVDVSVVKHGLAVVDGVTFDYAHHGPTGGIRQWTSGNQLRYYTRSLMNDELLRGCTPPRVVVRSHYHTYVRETVRVQGDREYVTDAVVTPAYCHLTEYSRQATRSAYLIGCGMVVCEVVDNELVEIHAYHRAVDLRRKEEL